MGYWGEITSDYDFCEKNYKVSFYVAEFFSAFSSIPIIIYGMYFLNQCVCLILWFCSMYKYSGVFCLRRRDY